MVLKDCQEDEWIRTSMMLYDICKQINEDEASIIDEDSAPTKGRIDYWKLTYICVYVKGRLHSMRKGQLVKLVCIWSCACNQCPINICKRVMSGQYSGKVDKSSLYSGTSPAFPLPNVTMVIPLR